MNNTNKNYRGKQEGYTLVEMAIALMIIGLLVAPLYALYQKYLIIKAHETTQRNVTAVTEAINSYRFANGFFPCPAPLDVGRGAVGYGLSTDCADVASVAEGNFGDGYSVMEPALRSDGENIYDSNGTNVTANADAVDDNIRVRRGAIPSVELGLTEDTALDGYGNKLTYVVTEQLADPAFMAAYSALNLDSSYLGAINVEDENDESLIFDDDTAGTTTPLTQYVVLSHGPDGEGAFRQDGVLVSACPAGEKQSLNCNLTAATAVFSNAIINTAAGAGFNDDTIRYYNRSQNTDAWEVTINNTNDIQLKPTITSDQLDIGVISGNDGISEIDGTILAEDTSAGADEGRFIATELNAPSLISSGQVSGAAAGDTVEGHF